MWARTINDVSQNRPTLVVPEQANSTITGQNAEKIGAVPFHKQRRITPNSKALLRLDFFEKYSKCVKTGRVSRDA